MCPINESKKWLQMQIRFILFNQSRLCQQYHRHQGAACAVCWNSYGMARSIQHHWVQRAPGTAIWTLHLTLHHPASRRINAHTYTLSKTNRDKGYQLTQHETKSFHIHHFTQRAVLCETIPGFGITFAVSFLLVFYHFSYCVYISLESETSRFDS